MCYVEYSVRFVSSHFFTSHSIYQNDQRLIIVRILFEILFQKFQNYLRKVSQLYCQSYAFLSNK